jgi:hypothetical protein
MRSHDDDSNEVTSGTRQVESILRSLTPSGGAVDPVAAAFAAGRRFQRGQLHAWQAAAAVLLGVATLSWIIPARHAGNVVRQVDPAPPVQLVSIETPIPPALPAQSVLLMTRAVSEGGVDALPAGQIPPPRNGRDLDELF